MFRTRRQNRYLALRDRGFLEFEARILSQVPFRVPYMPGLIRKRARDYSLALKQGWTKERYEASVRKDYKEKSWTKRDRLGRLVNDPWAMLREHEDRYRRKHPDYESPGEKKRKDWRKWTRKLEASLEKYPKRMPEVKLRYLPEGGAEIVEE